MKPHGVGEALERHGGVIAGQARYEAVLPALPSSVAKARQAVVRFGGDHGVNCQNLALAVSEAVSNAVVHALADQSDEAVYVEAAVDESAVVVTVRDRGIGIRPYPNPREGGFGLPLIKKTADQVAVSSSDSGVSIQMRFMRR